jgi:hypothetical protein
MKFYEFPIAAFTRSRSPEPETRLVNWTSP